MENRSKHIVKNTGALYIRMLFLMIVQLYTSRIILNVLGVEDYGIYNLVGGIVVIMQFMNNSLALAVNRYITFSLGKGNIQESRKVFSMAVNIHIILSFVAVFLLETIGLWFINTHLVIPLNRMFAANVVYQFSILSFILIIMRVPYNATIISHEKMGIYAYISIFEGLAKLGILYLLIISSIDQLEFYSFLTFVVSLIVFILYFIYTKSQFQETKYHYIWEKSLFIEMSKYAGYSTFGNLATSFVNQGQSILLNMFFGPVLNAVRGISMQVNGAVCGFISNIYTAVNPQITKSYAEDDEIYMKKLVYSSTKFSIYILLLLIIPLFFEIDFVLNIWLVKVPQYTNSFCRLILLNSLICYYATPSVIAIQATGNVKRIHLWTGSINLLNLVFSYVALKSGLFLPTIVFMIQIGISFLMVLATLLIQRKELNFKLLEYSINVIFPSIKVALLSLFVPSIIFFALKDNIYRFVLLCLLSTICTIIIIYYIGLNKQTRVFVINKIRNKLL
jgi:O-antigen/teichoic acid export membrane protein